MKLVIQTPSGPAGEVSLRPGINRVGRSANNDVSIAHPSVSSLHCEIVLENQRLNVRDLGSTNGTYIEGTRIQEATLELGQTLRLGEVTMTTSNDETLVKAPAAPGLKLSLAASGPVADLPAAPVVSLDESPPIPPPLPPPPSLLSARARKKRPSFSHAVGGAFGYPFKENGPYLLLAGTLLLVVVDFLTTFGFGFIALALGVSCTGYFFLFMQSIITTSANGDDDVPGWPDWVDWWETGVRPYLALMGICVFCLGPAWACRHFASEGSTVLSIGATQISSRDLLSTGLLVLGLLYLPMALLATTMFDSLGALNPLLVIASMLRVPAQYATICALLAVLCAGETAVVASINGFFHSWVVSQITERLFGLYSLMVGMRLLGVLYFTAGNRLGWPFK